MARDISFMQYMRAHGNTPSPTQKPFATAVISGLIASVPYLALLYFTDAIESVAAGFHVSVTIIAIVGLLLSVLGAIIYAKVFQRAANDTRGGWLFGMSFGFLLWTLGPVALWQTITGRPAAVGTAAMAIFGGHIVYGLVLGLVFPWIHFLLRGRLADVVTDVASREEHPLKEEQYER